MINWILSTAQSPEFWKSIIGFLTAGGMLLSPEQQNAIVAAGLAAMGIVNAWKHIDRPKP